LIHTIVERVYLKGKHVEALVLKPNYYIALGANKIKSSEDINSSEDIHKREGQDFKRTSLSRESSRFSPTNCISSTCATRTLHRPFMTFAFR
jgi:hypothetical protein